MKLALVIITGFTQTDGSRSGLYRLYHRLYYSEGFADRSKSFLAMRRWDSDHEELADMIVDHKPEQIAIIGYSYGCGHGAVQLCQHLQWHNRRVDMMMAIDPVPRYRFLPFKGLALARVGDWEVPSNVGECWSVRQVNDRPPGRVVVADSKHTVIHPPIVMGSGANLLRYAERHSSMPHPLAEADRIVDTHIGHSSIDNDDRVHRWAHGAVLRLLASPRREAA